METELHNVHVVPHTPSSTTIAVSEIPGYSHTPPNSSITVSELPGYLPHTGANEVLRQNSDNDDAAYEDIDNDRCRPTVTAREEEGNQMTAPQLPARAVTGIFNLNTM